MPGDATAAVDVDDGRAVGGSLPRVGALSCGVDGGVFEQQDGVVAYAGDHGVVNGALALPRIVVVDECVTDGWCETKVHDVQRHASSLRRQVSRGASAGWGLDCGAVVSGKAIRLQPGPRGRGRHMIEQVPESTHEMHARTRHARRWVWGAIVVIVGWFALSGVIGPAAGQLSSAQENDNATFLPADAEATRVIEQQELFTQESTLPVVVLFVSDDAVTPDQQQAVSGFVDKVPELFVETGPSVSDGRDMSEFLSSAPVTAVPSEDGQAVLVTVLLSEDKTTDALPNGESPVLAVAEALTEAADEAADPVGLESYVTGPGGLLADLVSVFGAIDSTLLLATALVVTLILILVYRSPFLWVIPLVSAGFALSLASSVVYLLATNDVLSLNGQSQGILTVLVFGAGTDYALLMVSRYREELHYYERPVDALKAAWRGTVEPILASGGTASLGLLMLLFSELNSNKSTGPVAAAGIAAALVVMLTLLPALLLVPSAALPLGAFLGVVIPGIVLELIFDTPLAPFAIVGGFLAVVALVAVIGGGIYRQFSAPGQSPALARCRPRPVGVLAARPEPGQARRQAVGRLGASQSTGRPPTAAGVGRSCRWVGSACVLQHHAQLIWHRDDGSVRRRGRLGHGPGAARRALPGGRGQPCDGHRSGRFVGGHGERAVGLWTVSPKSCHSQAALRWTALRTRCARHRLRSRSTGSSSSTSR